MSASSSIVDELLQRPDLPAVMGELEEAIADEARRRAAYREALDERTYAEFIRGEVVMHSPERWGHGKAERRLERIIFAFTSRHGLGEVAGNKLVQFPREDFIPDLCYWPKAVSDQFTDDTTIFPVPEIAVEILSASTSANDRGIKYEVYALGGVREYWIVNPEERFIELNDLDTRTRRFRLRTVARAQTPVTSTVLSGLSFPVSAAFDDLANQTAIDAIGSP
jgi:Uma2 family endonuclease